MIKSFLNLTSKRIHKFKKFMRNVENFQKKKNKLNMVITIDHKLKGALVDQNEKAKIVQDFRNIISTENNLDASILQSLKNYK